MSILNSSDREYDVLFDEASGNITYIPSGVTIEGNILASCNLIIHGIVKGDIKSTSKVLIGSEAEIHGNILAFQALIYGTVRGIVMIEDLLILKEKSSIECDIVTHRIVCEKDCAISGNIKFKKDNENVLEKARIIEAVRPVVKENISKEVDNVLKNWEII